jgi:hypothetical protein
VALASLGAVLFSIVAFLGAGSTAVVWGMVLLALGWPLFRLLHARVPDPHR